MWGKKDNERVEDKKMPSFEQLTPRTGNGFGSFDDNQDLKIPSPEELGLVFENDNSSMPPPSFNSFEPNKSVNPLPRETDKDSKGFLKKMFGSKKEVSAPEISELVLPPPITFDSIPQNQFNKSSSINNLGEVEPAPLSMQIPKLEVPSIIPLREEKIKKEDMTVRENVKEKIISASSETDYKQVYDAKEHQLIKDKIDKLESELNQMLVELETEMKKITPVEEEMRNVELTFRKKTTKPGVLKSESKVKKAKKQVGTKKLVVKKVKAKKKR